MSGLPAGGGAGEDGGGERRKEGKGVGGGGAARGSLLHHFHGQRPAGAAESGLSALSGEGGRTLFC